MQLLQQPIRQSIINLFSSYDLRHHLDEEWIQLFLLLPVLDHFGVPCCIYHDGQGYGSHRCGRMLKDSQKLCHAFQHFHVMAGDPLLRDEDDPTLLRELSTFLLHACCGEHVTKIRYAEYLASRLFGELKAWRRDFLVTRADSPMEPTNESDEPEPRPYRFSKIFNLGGSLRRHAQRRDRSASPGSSSDDSSSTIKPARKQTIRPMSSAPNINQTRRISHHVARLSVDVNWQDQEFAERARDRKRERFGLKSVVMTKLVAKI